MCSAELTVNVSHSGHWSETTSPAPAAGVTSVGCCVARNSDGQESRSQNIQNSKGAMTKINQGQVGKEIVQIAVALWQSKGSMTCHLPKVATQCVEQEQSARGKFWHIF